MKTYQIIAFAAIAFLFSSCRNNNKPEEEEQKRIVETIDQETGIISLSEREYGDTITVKGTLYNYKFTFKPVDSLKHIINSQGLEYIDNAVSLTIRKDSTVVTEKKFLKSSFKSYIPDDLWEHSGLVGFAFNFVRQERDAFYFIATIGDPDETADISLPLEIRITTDGGMTINKAVDLDTEPLRDGLNIDPSSEDGV